MAVRIGFDMDGVLADFSTAFREVEHRLFGPSPAIVVDSPEREAQDQENGTTAASEGSAPDGSTPAALRERRRAIWRAIHDTTDFWTALQPLDPRAVSRIHEMMLRKGWEVVFITQRPPTAGLTVQRQTQQWLCEQGFDLPSVLPIRGPRGAAAAALRLTYHVDDNLQHCFDVAADSRARSILIVTDRDQTTETSARRLRIAVTHSIGEALDVLEQVPPDGVQDEGLLDRLSRMVGWK